MYIPLLCGLLFFTPLIYDCLCSLYITSTVSLKLFTIFELSILFFLSLSQAYVHLKPTVTCSEVYFCLNLSLLHICNHFLNRIVF